MRNKKPEIIETKKIRRKKLKIGRLLVLLLVIIFIVGITINIDNIKAKNIIVTGNKYIKVSKLLGIAKINESTSYFGQEKNICKNLKEYKLLKSCKVKHNSNFELEIVIKEAKPLFYYQDSDKLMLNNNKMVDEENTYGVPGLINYVPKDVLDDFTKEFKKVNYDIIKSISDIEYTPSKNKDEEVIDDKRFMLSMNDGNTIYINIKHMNILNKYNKIYSAINDKKGIFNFDCDYNNYYFEPY